MDTSLSPLLIAATQDDGSHSGAAYSKALRQGRLLRLRRGIYVPTALWTRCTPSERYQLTMGASALQHADTVFCRQTALSLHGVPLLKLPQQVHTRASSAGAVRTVRQSPLTGRLPANEFWKRAKEKEPLDDVVLSPALLRGFDTARHAIFADPSPEPQEVRLQLPPPDPAATNREHLTVRTEPLDMALSDTLPRMDFPAAVIALEGAISSIRQRSSLDIDTIRRAAGRLPTSARKKQRLEHLLTFASSFSESPGESLARVRFHELGFVQPQQQVTISIDQTTYRLDFLWERDGVVGEFDGWMKYRDGFDEAWKKEKRREDAIRSTGLRVIRFYWEDVMEPGCTRLQSLLTRVGVPRI